MNPQPATINPQPAVHLHIERIVLDGLELGPGEATRFEAALTGELTRHLASVPSGSWTPSALARHEAAPIRVTAGQPASGLAATIAQSVFASVSPAASHPPGAANDTAI